MGIRASTAAPDDWDKFIHLHLNNSAPSSGHASLYLKGNDEIAAFESKVQARAAGFTQKVSVRQITKIAVRAICRNINSSNEEQSIVVLKKIEVLYRPGLRERVISTLFHSTISPIFVPPPTTDTILATTAVRLNGLLNDATAFHRSRDGYGGGGVWFPQISGVPTPLVLKMNGKYYYKHILAEQIFSRFFITPQYSSFSLESEIGKKFADKFRKLPKVVPEVPKWISSQRLEEANQRINEGGQITVMERIQGTSLTQLPKDKAIESLQDPATAQVLGEMLLLDILTGNGDRFKIGSNATCNAGNLMLLPEHVIRDGKPHVASIDHDYNMIAEADATVAKGMLNSIWGVDTTIPPGRTTPNPNRLLSVAESLIRSVSHRESSEVPIDELQAYWNQQFKKFTERLPPAQLAENLRIGFNRAKERFLAEFSEKVIHGLFDVPGLPNYVKPNLAPLLSLRTFLAEKEEVPPEVLSMLQ